MRLVRSRCVLRKKNKTRGGKENKNEIATKEKTEDEERKLKEIIVLSYRKGKCLKHNC